MWVTTLAEIAAHAERLAAAPRRHTHLEIAGAGRPVLADGIPVGAPDRINERTIDDHTVDSVAELERLKVLHNGEKVPLTFSDAEFERRLAGLRDIMADKDLDAVVLTSYHGIKYYSDFLFTTSAGRTPWSSPRTTGHRDGEHRRRDAVAAQFGENIVYTDWRRDNSSTAFSEVAATARHHPAADRGRGRHADPRRRTPSSQAVFDGRRSSTSPRTRCASG